MNNNWKTSVAEIVEIFRGALLAIIPWIEKARIKWKDGAAYDDWDNIAQALFKNIVCSSIEGEVLSEYSLANYDFHYKDYSGLDYIRVKSESHVNEQLVFISFQTESTPLDKVKVGILDSTEKITGFLNFDLSNIEFSLEKKIDGKRTNIEAIGVVM